MLRESELRQLIGLVYDAAENPALWPTFLERYAVGVAANVAVLQIHRFAQKSSELIVEFGLASPLKHAYNQHYSRVNVWRDRGRSKYTQGRVILDPEMAPRTVLEASEFFNEYLVKIRGVYCAAGVIARERDEALMLTALRSQGQRPWEESERTTIQILLPHLTRAHGIHNRLRLLDAQECLLDTLDVGVAFLTGTGEVVACNRPAEELLRQGGGLSIRNGILRVVHDSSADSELRNAISAVVASPAVICPAAVSVPRLALKRPLQVVVAPLRRDVPMLAGMRSPQAVALIIDPDAHRPTSIEALIRLYGFTPREAALASALSVGKTVQKAADDLRMTYETARTHLRRIFAKTSTARQAELIMLLGRLPKQNTDE